jgi:hypothetical protein
MGKHSMGVRAETAESAGAGGSTTKGEQRCVWNSCDDEFEANEEGGHEIDLVHSDWAVTEGEVALVPQAAPMVLNLEDPFASSPAVLDLELERMSLDEMRDFEVRMDKASIIGPDCASTSI